ncbi:MAG TPA: hypothetical protein DCZ94_02740 [Lentisphaeria bacterium]|nr:MAG: hypothetical protein A2X48_08105 [Lentisphaerae bacterium GWF2_49_21]HBC85851.1 hypothetical protein [Lentisphaeria bacterium]
MSMQDSEESHWFNYSRKGDLPFCGDEKVCIIPLRPAIASLYIQDFMNGGLKKQIIKLLYWAAKFAD